MKSFQINNFDLWSSQVNFWMHCISSSERCLVGNGDQCHRQSRMERQPDLVTWVLVQSTMGLCRYNYNLCYSTLARAAVAPAHLQLWAEVFGSGCCVHTPLPPTQLSTPCGMESNAKFFCCSKLLLPGGKASAFLRIGHPCSLWRLLSPALLSSDQLHSCRRGNPPPWFRAQTWQSKAQCRNKCPHTGMLLVTT